MSGIVYQTDKRSGSTYAYRHRMVLDPDTGRMRARREYIGRVDPSTGEIIPKAERGRHRKHISPVAGDGASVAELAAALRDRDEELGRLREQVLALSERNAELESVIEHVAAAVAKAKPGLSGVVGTACAAPASETVAPFAASDDASDTDVAQPSLQRVSGDGSGT